MRRLLGIVALLSSTAALAESNWVFIGVTGATKDTIEYDANSVKRDGEYVTFWMRKTTPTEERTSRVRINCKEDSISSLGYLIRDRSGKITSSDLTPDYTESAIPPDTVAAKQEELLCKR